ILRTHGRLELLLHDTRPGIVRLCGRVLDRNLNGNAHRDVARIESNQVAQVTGVTTLQERRGRTLTEGARTGSTGKTGRGECRLQVDLRAHLVFEVLQID